MSVFRVEKTNNFTIMANYHFKDKRLSLKAKGLLSTMLSLPEEWNYTLVGLSKICREGLTSIRSAIAELEEYGYLERERIRNASGQYEDIEYIIREKPLSDEPLYDKPSPKNPASENPAAVSRTSEKRTQSSTKRNNDGSHKEKKKSKIDGSKDLSINRGGEKVGDTQKNDRIDTIDYTQLEKTVKENIEYECLCERYDESRVDEVVNIMTDMLCSTKATIHVAGEDFPAALVKSRLMKIDAGTVEYVFECMKKNPTKIRNIKSYLKTALYNSVSTVDAYYAAEVNHDLYGQKNK